MKNFYKNKHFTSSQLIIGGFLLVILAGTLLLMLPAATRDKGGAPFTDCLFTATSAVCVTGLILHDTAAYWAPFGQFVILTLIQIGGMGVITIALSIVMFSGRKIGLAQRSTMQEAISAPHVGGIVKMTGFIIKVTIFAELIASVVMSPVFCKEFGALKGIWYSFFHSISAFCNAGFDLMGAKESYSSLIFFSSHPLINIVIMFLIIFGGIGFLTWDDMRTNKFHLKKYRMQSKVILLVTAILIILPSIYFYFIEFSPEKRNGLPTGERILNSFFQSVTTRTAGFNTVDLTELTESGKGIMILLMLIGGSPGSTAGGMKTTTAAVLIVTAFSVFRRREDPHCFGRRVSLETVKNAATVLIMYIILFSAGGFIISCIEELPLLECFFETASAIGTVGLSLGLTPTLGTVSRIILIILMFCGRVGGLTLIFAAFSELQKSNSKLPQEKITVG